MQINNEYDFFDLYVIFIGIMINEDIGSSHVYFNLDFDIYKDELLKKIANED